MTEIESHNVMDIADDCYFNLIPTFVQKSGQKVENSLAKVRTK